MKPAIVSHHDYKSSLRKRLDAIYPDKSRIPKNIGIIYRKFRDLDLSEVDRMMQPKYSHVGPKPWSPSFLLRALLVAIAFKCTSITKWVEQLRASPILAIICGFAPDHIPCVGTFYDFMSRLWDLPTDNYNQDTKSPPKKVKAPKGKGQKASSIEKESVADLIKRLSTSSMRLDQEAYCTLFRIFRTCFLNESIRRGVIHPLSLRMSGDGTPVVTSARVRSHHTCDCPSKGIFDCDCPRRFSQPDCNIGWDSSRDKFYFGYDMYILTDTEHDLPLFAMLNPAAKHDSHSFCEAFFRFNTYAPDLLPRQLLLDAAHDSMAMYQLCKQKHIQPFIDLNKGNSKKSEDYHGVVLGPDGVPVCPKGFKMKPNGNDLQRHYAKYICPCMSKHACTCDNPCSSAKFGRTCSIPLDSNIRLYTAPVRDSAEWKSVYNSRTASERCNKRLKNDYLLECGAHRSTKFWYIRSYLIMMLLHLDAWGIPQEF